MKTNRNNKLGFTILELIVVVSIIGILGAIAIPAYQGYVTKAKETKAQNTLQSIYMMEKNFFSQNYCYYKSAGASNDTTNINNYLFGSTAPTLGPIEVGATNNFNFYITGTTFTCPGSSCIALCSSNGATDFTIYAVNKINPSQIFSINYQNIKTGF